MGVPTGKMMQRPVTVLMIVMLGVGIAGPALAQDDGFVNPIHTLIDIFDPPEGMEYATRLIQAPITGLSTNPDPHGDFEHATGEEPGYRPDHVDITHTSTLQLDAGPLQNSLFGPTDENELWAPSGLLEVDPPNYDPFPTVTGEEPHDGSQFTEGSVLFGFRLAGTPTLPVPGVCEYVVWINDLSRGSTFVNHPSFPGDPASGTNLAFGLRLSPEGEGVTATFAWHYQEESGFVDDLLTDIRSFITPDYVGIMVPIGQIGEMAAVNFYTFCMEEGTTNFEPEKSGADQAGLTALTLGDLGLVAIEQTPIPTSTTNTIAEPTSTPAETNSQVPTGEGEATPETDSGFPWWLVLIVGFLAIAASGWLILRRQDDRCKRLQDRWRLKIEKADAAQAEASAAADGCKSVQSELADLQASRRELCEAWPPVCWKSEEGDSMEDSQGRRFTSRDVHMRKLALGDEWDDYRAGKLTALQVEARWQQMDTPEFRDEISKKDLQFKNQLEQIDTDIRETAKRFDDLCQSAIRTRAKADKTAIDADSARIAYERCIESQSEAKPIDRSPTA